MRTQQIAGKFKQLLNTPWRSWFRFLRGWAQRHRTGRVPCAFPLSRRLVNVPLAAFYESYRFCCEEEQGLREMKFFLAKLHPGDILFDIGAFYGAFGAAAKAAYGESLDVHCFEPVAANLARIAEIYERNQFERFSLVNKAVGGGTAISGEVDAFDGMLRHCAPSTDSNVQSTGHGGVSFPTTTVDRYVHDTGIDPSILKIDVEGFESDVLEGAAATLRDFGPRIWLELHPSFLRERGKDWRALVTSLEAVGYRVSYFEDSKYEVTKDIAFHIWCERDRGAAQLA